MNVNPGIALIYSFLFFKFISDSVRKTEKFEDKETHFDNVKK